MTSQIVSCITDNFCDLRLTPLPAHDFSLRRQTMETATLGAFQCHVHSLHELVYLEGDMETLEHFLSTSQPLKSTENNDKQGGPGYVVYPCNWLLQNKLIFRTEFVRISRDKYHQISSISHPGST